MSPAELLRLLTVFAEPFSRLVDLVVADSDPSEDDTQRLAYELMRAVWNERARKKFGG